MKYVNKKIFIQEIEDILKLQEKIEDINDTIGLEFNRGIGEMLLELESLKVAIFQSKYKIEDTLEYWLYDCSMEGKIVVDSGKPTEQNFPIETPDDIWVYANYLWDNRTQEKKTAEQEPSTEFIELFEAMFGHKPQ